MSNLTPQAQKILMKAFALRNEGKLDASLKQARAVSKKYPENTHISYLLGSLYLEKNRYKEAQTHFEKGIKTDPNGNINQGGLGMVFYRLGNLTEAKTHLSLARKRAPAEYSHILNLAIVLYDLGELSEAEPLLRLAYKQNPTDSQTSIKLANIYIFQEQYDNAGLILSKNAAANSNDINSLLSFANFLNDRTQISQAHVIYQNILKIDPDNVDAHTSLFDVESQQGNKQEALIHLHALAKLNIDQIDTLANALKISKSDQIYGNRLPSIIDDILDKINQPSELEFLSIPTLYNLSYIYESHGLYDNSFQVLSLANQKKKSLNKIYDMEFNRNSFIDYIEKIRSFEKWEELLISFRENDSLMKDDKFVFILALPRSGTTLLEQIISSHPDAMGIGETRSLSILKRNMNLDSIHFSPDMMWPDTLLKMSKTERHDLAQNCLNQVTSGLQTENSYCIVDKSISNFLFVGLLAALYPNSKFIYCKRERAASGLSIFQQNFATQFLFDNDLEDINFMFDIIEEIIPVWNDIIGNQIHTVSYEDLVEDPENVSKNILNYIGLNWDPKCLEFHKNQSVIKTASVHQARKAIYKSSSERYLKYKTHLSALMKQ